MSADLCISGELSAEQQQELKQLIGNQLSKMLGMEVEDVMPEYVLVMVNNHKTMQEIGEAMRDFLSEDATEFIEWLTGVLGPIKQVVDSTKQDTAEERCEPIAEKAPLEETRAAPVAPAQPAGKRRVVSLKSVKTSMSERRARFQMPNDDEDKEKEVDKKDRPRKNDDSRDLRELLSSRNRNNGRRDTRQQSQDRGRKNKRMADLLGPPTTDEQAELDARDHSKKRRGDNRRQDQGNESNDNGNRSSNRDRHQGDGRRMPRGQPRGPRPPRGDFGYPPPEMFGGPGMFPPRGHPMHHPFMPPNPYMYPPHPRAFQPRPFTNKTWVNPANASTEESKEDTAGQAGAPQQPPHQHYHQQQYAPRPQYFRGYGYPRARPRPHFANKKWVRPDATAEDGKTAPVTTAEEDAKLSDSLPKTP